MGITESGGDKIKADLERIANGLPGAAKEAIQETLEVGEQQAKSTVHVVTGRLRDSIRIEMQGDEQGDLVAGGQGGVDYAAIEELGNSTREGHPYLRPAFEMSTKEAENKLKSKVDGLI